MPKELIIQTDEETLARLMTLAERQQRSQNDLANEALQRYLYRAKDALATAAAETIPVVTRLEDLRGDFWQEDDTEDFLAYLRAEREQSLADDERRG